MPWCLKLRVYHAMAMVALTALTALFVGVWLAWMDVSPGFAPRVLLWLVVPSGIFSALAIQRALRTRAASCWQRVSAIWMLNGALLGAGCCVLRAIELDRPVAVASCSVAAVAWLVAAALSAPAASILSSQAILVADWRPHSFGRAGASRRYFGLWTTIVSLLSLVGLALSTIHGLETFQLFSLWPWRRAFVIVLVGGLFANLVLWIQAERYASFPAWLAEQYCRLEPLVNAIGVESVPTTVDIGTGEQRYGRPLAGAQGYRLPPRRRVQLHGLVEFAGLMVMKERSSSARLLAMHGVANMTALAVLVT